LSITSWRIYKHKHASSAFTGEGAGFFGGRWNSRGTRIIYTAATLSLASLEMLIHLESSDALGKYIVRSVDFDDKLLMQLDGAVLPVDWHRNPVPSDVQQIGDEWVAQGRSAILQVPSAVIETESNFLLNPNHRDFHKLRWGAEQPFFFDPRLLKS